MTRTIKLTEEHIKLSKPLTALQRRVVLNIVSQGMSQRQAYIKAGGRAKTKETQDNSASVMLSNSKVKAFHDSLVKATVSNAIMTRAEILENLSDMGRTTITDLIELDNNSNLIFKSTENLSINHARSVSELTITGDGLKMKLYSSKDAMKQIVAMEGWNAATEVKVTGQLDITNIERKIVKSDNKDKDANSSD